MSTRVTSSALLVVLCVIIQPTMAGTVAYWRVEDGAAGTTATALTSLYNNAQTQATGTAGTRTFSSDVIGPLIFDPVARTIYVNNTSVETDSAGRFDVPDTLTEPREFTVEAFIKSNSTPAWGRVIQKRRGTGGNCSWRLDSRTVNLAIRMDTEDPGPPPSGLFNESSVGSFTLNDGQWHHIAMTYTDGVAGTTAGVARLYVDYNLDVTFTPSNYGVVQYDGGLFSFAGAPSSGAGLAGLIDEVRFSNGVLTTNQFLRVVPEPSSLMLLLIGALGAALWHRRRRS